jgi:hypothetical protein
MEEQVTRGTLDLSNSSQDADRNDTVPAGLWQDLSSASWTWVQIPLGDQAVEYGSPISRSEKANSIGWIGWMEGKAYHSSKLYKERMKRWHDKHIKIKHFKAGDKVLLFNSRICLFGHGKLRTKWEGLT